MKRVRPLDILAGDWWTGEPYIADTRSIDITDTIVAMIQNAPEGMAAVSLRFRDLPHLTRCERAARQRNARIIWLRMPVYEEIA